MSHRCGSGCRRKQTRSRRSSCPTCGASRKLPETITAGGRVRRLTRHLREEAHPGITTKRIARVLDDWVVRGNCVDTKGNRAITHWGFVQGLKDLVKVVVSLDDERIITAYRDPPATRHWNRGTRAYFDDRCLDLEERNASNLR